MRSLPEWLRLNVSAGRVVTKVPKGHLRAHEESCHGPMSLNYTEGAGETDGEGIERLWSWLNKVAPSIKEMTPAARQELLDDLCAFLNWRKNNGLGSSLARRMLEAINQAKVHQEEYLAFNAQLRESNPARVAEWETMLDTWTRDPTAPCPYTSSRPRRFHISIQIDFTHT